MRNGSKMTGVMFEGSYCIETVVFGLERSQKVELAHQLWFM